ncbi:hypothetical protein [Enterobacter cloacae complex sp. 339J8]|uniref:hypothetical protein n=1 Tax=Enterobacter cloacae complex sp. 339J8 TaxID=3395869 RepID=UPI003CF20BC1
MIAKISHSLSDGSEDADKIQTAMNDALVEALNGKSTFDPSDITDDVIIETMICYLTDSIFLQITMMPVKHGIMLKMQKNYRWLKILCMS